MAKKVGIPSHHIGFLDHFSKLDDPRQINKSLYPLQEILLLVLCAVLSGADDWVAISLYGEKKLSFLRRFLPYENGTPSHDQLGYLFGRIDEKRFQQCFVNWVTCVRHAIKGVVAIDGKTLRRSFDAAGKKGAIHMVSAWCSEQNLVLGQVKFDSSVSVAGLVLNRVGSGRHEQKVRSALERYCDVPVLGAIPYRAEVEIVERHLGLTPLQEAPGLASRIEELGRTAARYLDLEGITALAKGAPPMEVPPAEPAGRETGARVTLGVARDRAFNFYYPENLEALEAAGARLVPFSPLEDPAPPEADGLYIGGGFPEFFMAELEHNGPMRAALRKAVEGGLPVWAECGGLMYLSRRIRWGGDSRDMVGVFPCEVDLSERPAGHGYVLLEETGDGPWPRRGVPLRGHEFHHSRIMGLDDGARFAFKTLRGSGAGGGRDGLISRNCIAAYTHLHADGAPFWAGDLVSFLLSCRKGRP
ncbi:MAG: cobyrinate a,c-diamide synthase [Thermodesulfobacteriota bacterium]